MSQREEAITASIDLAAIRLPQPVEEISETTEPVGV